MARTRRVVTSVRACVVNMIATYEHARRRRMYITYRAREKLRAFTCTCGAREAQLAARDGHLWMNVHVSDAYMSYM